MSKFDVLILGSASASPTLSRNPTSQLININDQLFLVDCGEGTQLQLRKHKAKFQRLNHIFISHLHGDHYLGLIGLLQTMHLLGRVNELNIYGPDALEEIIEMHLKHSKSFLKYPINFKATSSNDSEIIFENKRIEVSTIILKHRIPCTGFLFREKPKPRKINAKAIIAYQIPKYAINNLKLGKDYKTEEGKIIENKLLTITPEQSFSYAFCSDTKYYEGIIPTIKDVDLLYHEATFTEEHKDRAKSTFHSTAKQAAEIAKKSNAKQLIIGHFSNRYYDLSVLLNEAKTVFEETDLALEGKTFDVSNIPCIHC